MDFIKKTLTLVVLLQLTACVTGSNFKDSSSSLVKVVKACSIHHQQNNTNFSVIDASNLGYYIVVGGSEISSNEPKNYCHIDKVGISVLYANSKEPYFKNAKGSIEYESHYAEIADGKIFFGQIKIIRYKFIAGQWRYIETKLVSS